MSTDPRKRTFLRFAAGALGAATLAACGRKDEPPHRRLPRPRPSR